MKAGKIEAASVCDHIEPHKGDPGLFWDTSNIQTLCKSCHDSLKQSMEKRGYDKTIELDGWPSDPEHPANKVSHRN
jgi:5-methylcytosine-specific restriction endonuclease McrA